MFAAGTAADCCQELRCQRTRVHKQSVDGLNVALEISSVLPTFQHYPSAPDHGIPGDARPTWRGNLARLENADMDEVLRAKRQQSRLGDARDNDPRRARAQSQECRPGNSARQARRVHRPVRLRQILARVRHHLCRGPAPLRRVALGLCAPVPRDDAEAGRRPDRRPVAGDLDRAEDHVEEPALHRRHRHRDLRLYAPVMGARRRALFARDGLADRKPDRVADGRPRAGAARRHAPLSAGAGRARPQGRVSQGTRRISQEGFSARQDRRHVP